MGVALVQSEVKNPGIDILFGLRFKASAVVAGGSGWPTPIVAAIVHNVGSMIASIASARLAIFP